MNLAELESRMYDRLTFTQTPASDVVARVRRNLNSEYRLIMGKKHLEPFRRTILTFASVADSPFAVMPQACTRIVSIQDRTNHRGITEMTLPRLRAIDPGLDQSSSAPDFWIPMNMAAGVNLQPSDASELFVKSSSASDDSTKEIFVQGLITGGYHRMASVAMNGTTAVSLGATITSWIEITKFYVTLAAGGTTTAAGSITLHEDSGIGTELARIPIGRSYPRYSRIQLYPYPTASLTYHADVELHVEDLAEANDEPLIPEDYQEIIIEGAMALDYERRKDWPAYNAARARRKEIWNDLCSFAARQVPPSEPQQWNHLGPYFPAFS